MIWKRDLIDEKALEAQNGEEYAVRALADEVFKAAEFADIPTKDRELMKARVLSHELDYRSGSSEGIREENIVLTINELADKFNAPDYAKTSALQVRVLRASFLKDYPNFIAQETSGGEKILQASIGDSVSPTMSPLEAVYMTALMIEQKLLNEYYQYPPQQWVDKVYNKAVERWQADSARTDATKEEGEITYRLTAPTNLDQRAEMRRCLTDGLATLLSSDPQNLMSTQSLIDETLDTLGILREAEERK